MIKKTIDTVLNVRPILWESSTYIFMRDHVALGKAMS